MPVHKRRTPARGGAGARRSDLAGQRDHSQNTSAFSWSASYFSVHDGRTCLGHALVGHREFKAFDAAERPLGTFTTRDEARAAVSAAHRSST
jgi:hypothetical protein